MFNPRPFVLTYLIIATFAGGGAFAGCGSDKATGLNGVTWYCNRVGNWNENLGDGTKVYSSSGPNMLRCRTSTWCDEFVGDTASCGPGTFDPATMVYEITGDAKTKNGCWTWKCKGGQYSYESAGTLQCIDAGACKALPNMEPNSSNYRCESSSWCNDNWKNKFNPSIHNKVGGSGGTCGTFSCKAGDQCLNVDLGCEKTQPGVWGGQARVGVTCVKCNPNEYPPSGGVGCTAGTPIAKDRFSSCYQEPVLFNACSKCSKAGWNERAGTCSDK